MTSDPLYRRFKRCHFTDAEECKLRDLLNQSVYEKGSPVARVDARSGEVTEYDFLDIPGWTTQGDTP